MADRQITLMTFSQYSLSNNIFIIRIFSALLFVVALVNLLLNFLPEELQLSNQESFRYILVFSGMLFFILLFNLLIFLFKTKESLTHIILDTALVTYLTALLLLNILDLQYTDEILPLVIALTFASVLYRRSVRFSLGLVLLYNLIFLLYIALYSQSTLRIHLFDLIAFAIMNVIIVIYFNRQFREHYRVLIQLHDKNRELERLSLKDPLTGAWNRRYLYSVLQGELTRYVRHGQIFSLIMVDIDHFKQLNDTYGHQAGDTVLLEMCRIFREELRSEDSVSRYGGEEFILLLVGNDREGALAVAERILSRVRRNSFTGIDQRVTFSAGIAEVAEGLTIDGLISLADANLYRAKQTGRNRIETAPPIP